MNQRFRKLVGSTRRSSNQSVASQASASAQNLSSTPPNLTPVTNGGAASIAASTATAASSQASGAQTPSASSTSLAMNNPQQPLGRPPSYQYANTGSGNLGTPHPNQGRPNSPMPPPPINTGGGHAYAPQHQQQLYQQPAPPGYPMQQQYGYGAPQQHHAYQQRLAEVEGSQRSKAQLIVGIDFVRAVPLPRLPLPRHGPAIETRR